MSKGLARRCQILDWKTLQKLRKKDSSLVSPEKDGVVGMTGALMNGVNGVNGANGRESGPDEERNGKQRRGSKVDKADKAERISARLAHLAEECHVREATTVLSTIPILPVSRGLSRSPILPFASCHLLSFVSARCPDVSIYSTFPQPSHDSYAFGSSLV
jgi:hypothetical protein